MKVSASSLLKISILLTIFGNLVYSYSSKMSYFHDAINILCILFLIINIKRVMEFKEFTYPLFVLFFVILLGVIFNHISVMRFLWGIRNNFRYIILFYFVLLYAKKENLEWTIKIFLESYKLHVILTGVQFALGYKQDYLGGILGTVIGSNGGTVVYLLIVLFIELIRYTNKKIKLGALFAIIVSMMLNAALAEIKVLYLLIPAFIGLYFLCVKNKMRAFIPILIIIAILPIAISVLVIYFPEFSNFFTLSSIFEQLFDSTSTYSTANDIGRSSVFYKIPLIVQKWAGKANIIYGIGMGNAEYSTAFKSLNSNFYNRYYYTHYTWFSSAFLLIETGYVGFIAFILIFVSLFVYFLRRYRTCSGDMALLGIMLSSLSICIVFYNSAIRMSFSYFIFLFLGLAYKFYAEEVSVPA